MLETHINGAISWLETAIENNQHEEKYEQYSKFNDKLDEVDEA